MKIEIHYSIGDNGALVGACWIGEKCFVGLGDTIEIARDAVIGQVKEWRAAQEKLSRVYEEIEIDA